MFGNANNLYVLRKNILKCTNFWGVDPRGFQKWGIPTPRHPPSATPLDAGSRNKGADIEYGPSNVGCPEPPTMRRMNYKTWIITCNELWYEQIILLQSRYRQFSDTDTTHRLGTLSVQFLVKIFQIEDPGFVPMLASNLKFSDIFQNLYGKSQKVSGPWLL